MRAELRLAGIALLLACGREDAGRAPAAEPVALAPADADGRLDPVQYRGTIEAAEKLLFSAEGLADDDWKALSKALLELHNEIVFADSSPSARETSARLFFLSARADAMSSGRHTDFELTQLRELWRQLRADKFAPAIWMRAEPPPR